MGITEEEDTINIAMVSTTDENAKHNILNEGQTIFCCRARVSSLILTSLVCSSIT